ncbi:MAG: glycosyltransferase, partial [Planctomycetaceae bacterium]|nr:glycosyltransferase [Planctomycetaceae bacterium]
CGIPAVASPVGVNSHIVEHGRNSFLARTDDEWTEYLGQLVESAELRKEIGTAARKTVAEKYSIEANFPRYEQALMQLCQQKSG